MWFFILFLSAPLSVPVYKWRILFHKHGLCVCILSTSMAFPMNKCHSFYNYCMSLSCLLLSILLFFKTLLILLSYNIPHLQLPLHWFLLVPCHHPQSPTGRLPLPYCITRKSRPPKDINQLTAQGAMWAVTNPYIRQVWARQTKKKSTNDRQKSQRFPDSHYQESTQNTKSRAITYTESLVQTHAGSAITASVSEFPGALLSWFCVLCSPSVLNYSGSNDSFSPLFHRVPELLEEGMMEDSNWALSA